MKFVRINTNGTMDECEDTINLKNIRKVFESQSKTKGSKRIQYLYSWTLDTIEYMCYGWTSGKAGKENKHDLPPSGIKIIDTCDNSDTQLLFGDIFIIRKNKKLMDLDISDYGEFYSECFGGFDDCKTDDETDDEETTSLDGFIVDDDKSDSEYNSDTELDEDLNDY